MCMKMKKDKKKVNNATYLQVSEYHKLYISAHKNYTSSTVKHMLFLQLGGITV